MKAPPWLERKGMELPKGCRIAQPKAAQIKSKNVKMHSLEQMLGRDASFARKAFGWKALDSPQATALMHGFHECRFFFVDPGKKAELELRYDNSLSLNFIFISEGASLRLCNSAVSDTMNMVVARLSEDATLDTAFLKHKGVYAYHGLATEAGTGASVSTSSFWGGSGSGETLTMLKGAGSRALHICLSSTGDSEDLSLDSRVSHSSNSTRSEVVMRGVAEDSSSTRFKGKVVVEGNGRGSWSSLEQQVLLLDKEAKAEADPVLEIKNNDVECSHSAAVRQLEESKLFYLMSRGIARKKAKSTLVMGFLRSAMNRIRDKELRNVFMPPFMRD